MCAAMMADASKSLIWPDHCRLINERLHQLYIGGELVDVALIAGHYQVFAHRAILAAASPVFLSQLQVLATPPVQIHLDSLVEGCSGQEVNSLLEFIYCGKVSVPQQRLSIFFNLARHLQLIGFQEPQLHSACMGAASQRSVCYNASQRCPGGSTRPLHLAIAEPLQTSALPNGDLQNFLPQIPLPLTSTFPITESQTPHSLPQLVDNNINMQQNTYMNSVIQDNCSNPSTVVSMHGKYHGQDFVDNPLKCGEHFKLNNCPMRNLSGSLSNATFSDLCSAEADMNLFLHSDNRPVNSNIRQAFPEVCSNDSTYQNSNLPRDYSQPNLRVISHGLFESEANQNVTSTESQPMMALNAENPVDWTNFVNNSQSIPASDSMHTMSQQMCTDHNQGKFLCI